MRDIKDLRLDIDEIDKELVKLFEKRMSVVEEVAAYKINNNKPLRDPEREAALIKKNVDLLSNPTYARLLSVFFKDIMEYSRTHQQELMGQRMNHTLEMKENPMVVYQGIEGSFSSIALKQFFKKSHQTRSKCSFEETLETLYNGEADYAVLPIENSSTGAINEVYDLLLKYELHIIGDVYLKVKHHLIGQDSSLDLIKSVYSHEQAFKQSRTYLKQHKWSQFSYSNTAESVKHVKELNDRSIAAIGSKEAADVYGLSVLEENIHDHDYNTTRFVVLSKKESLNDKSNKISLVVRLSHEPKALFTALEAIAEQKINMLKIESRPIPDKPWAYMFYIDIEGSLNDPLVSKAIDVIKGVTHSVLILGNYYSRNGASE